MSNRQEEAVKKFCQAWGDGTRQRPDKELILSMMHPDAEWTLWVPGGAVHRGRAAIAAEIDRQTPMMEHLDCRIRGIASTGNTVFAERSDHFVFMGQPASFDLVAIFELDTDNRIRTWREYFDTASIATTLGIEQGQI